MTKLCKFKPYKKVSMKYSIINANESNSDESQLG